MGLAMSMCDCFPTTATRKILENQDYLSADDQEPLSEDCSWQKWSSVRGSHISPNHEYQHPVYRQQSAEAEW